MKRLFIIVVLLLMPSLASAETVIEIAEGTYPIAQVITTSGTAGNWIRYRPEAGATVILEGGGDIDKNYVILDGFLFDGSLDPGPTTNKGVDVFGNPVRIENSEVRGVNDVHNGYDTTNVASCKEFDFGLLGHGIRVAAGGSLTITDSEVWGFRDAFTINAPDAEVTIERTLVRNNFNGVSQEGKTVIIKDSVFWDTPNHQFAIKEDNTVADSLFHLENNLLINSQDMVKLGEAWEGADNAYIVHNTFWLPADDPCGEYAGLSLEFVRDSLVIRDNILVSLRNGLLQFVDTEFFTRDGGAFMDSDYNLIFQHDPLTSEQPPDEWPDEFRLDGNKVKHETWASASCTAGNCQDANSIVRQDPLFVAAPIYNITPLAQEELPQPGTPANEWGWEVPTSIAEVEGWFALDPNSPAIGAASDGLNIGYNAPTASATVEQWHRTTIDTGQTGAACDAVTGTRDEVQFQATFTHSGGTTITMPGYYGGAADDRYLVDFMPTLTGTWTWETCSIDDCTNSPTGAPDLTLDSAMDCNALDGIPSNSSTQIVATEGYLEDDVTLHPGQFETDGNGKWRFSDSGEYVVPLGLRTAMFWEPIADTTNSPPGNFVYDPNAPDFTASVNYLAGMGMNFFETNLFDGEGVYDPNGVIGGTPRQYNYAFDGAGGAGESAYNTYDMEETLWTRFAARQDIMTQHNQGVQIMPYQDRLVAYCGLTGSTLPNQCDFNDSGRAGGGAEALLARYMVARTAAQPFVWYNYAIDYEDIRTEADADAWLARLALLDPYNHPASVRHKDEPGGQTQPEATPQTYDSEGKEDDSIFTEWLSVLEREIGAQTNCDGGPCSVSFDDSVWEESYSCIAEARRGHEETARRAAFKVLMLGGAGVHFRGANGTPCAPEASCSTRRSEWYFWLGDDGVGNSCLNQVDLWTPAAPGTTVINQIVTNDLGSEFANMWPSPSTLNTGPDITQAGDANEYALYDDVTPDTILLYAIGEENEGPPTGNPGDPCAPCDGDITVDVSDVLFAGYTYTGEWINPRTGVRTDMTTPSSFVGNSTPATVVFPPDELTDDWLLILTSGGVPTDACNDGNDNDGDGLVDWPADPGCLNSTDANERGADGPGENCNDGAGGTMVCPECDDTVNDDNDPHTDYPDDPGCLSANDVNELSGTCVGGSEPGTDCIIDGDCAGAGTCDQIDCDDNVDNDTDTFTDFDADSGCASATDPTEIVDTTECGNGLDDDGDGFCDTTGSTCTDGSTPGDLGCDTTEDLTEGILPGVIWTPPCTAAAYIQVWQDVDIAGGGITSTLQCTGTDTMDIDTTFDPNSPQSCTGDTSCNPDIDTAGNIIDFGHPDVLIRPVANERWVNRDVCTGAACDANVDGIPDVGLCPQGTAIDEQTPRVVVVRGNDNEIRNGTFEWFGDGIVVDNSNTTGTNINNITFKHLGDSGFKNEGSPNPNGAYNTSVTDVNFINMCDKATQLAGRTAGLHADPNDYDVEFLRVTGVNSNQGFRATGNGRFRFEDITWSYNAGALEGADPNPFRCDNAFRPDTNGALFHLVGDVSVSGCTGEQIICNDSAGVIIEGAANAVFEGAVSGIEVLGSCKASIEGAAIQGNTVQGIFLNSQTAEVDCGGGSIDFTPYIDGVVTSAGGNTFSSNPSLDVQNDRSAYTLRCESNTFDCPVGPKVSGTVDTDPLAVGCSAVAGTAIIGVDLSGVKFP